MTAKRPKGGDGKSKAAGANTGGAKARRQRRFSATAKSQARALIEAVETRNWPAARARAATLLKKEPDDPQLLLLAAYAAFYGANDAERARKLLCDAHALAPDRTDILKALAGVLWSLGDAKETAATALRLLHLKPGDGATYHLLHLAAPEMGERLRPAVETLIAEPALDPVDRAALFATLGRIDDRAGRIEPAFRSFARSKTLAPRPYNGEQLLQYLAACRAAYRADAIDGGAAEGQDDRRMTFIVGMPRSGSTLIERALAAHPQVASAGERSEFGAMLQARFAADPTAVLAASASAKRKAGQAYLDALRPYLRAPWARRWVDKMPGNILHGGAIATLLPKARIIVTERDPRDVALSCMKTYFTEGHGFVETPERFAHYQAVLNAFAQLWRERLGDRVLTVRYEDMVCDFEGQARRLVAHLSLDWDPACAAPDQLDAAVATASAAQVRQPIYTSSVGAWRRYAEPLAAHIQAMKVAGVLPADDEANAA